MSFNASEQRQPLSPFMTYPAPASSTEGGTTRHAHYGEHWGEGAARCFSIETDILDEDHAVRLMPVPDSFVCPIAASIMRDPVATVDGCVYEREYIERWFRVKRQESQQITSPITGLDLPTATLMPLVALQRAIEAYLAHRPELKREHMAGRSFAEAATVLQSDLFEKQAEHASIQDKMKRLRQANKTLTKIVQEQNERILELEAQCSRSPQPSASSRSRAPKPETWADSTGPDAPATAQSAADADTTPPAPASADHATASNASASAHLRSSKSNTKPRYLASLALPLLVTLALYLILKLCPWAFNLGIGSNLEKVPAVLPDSAAVGNNHENKNLPPHESSRDADGSPADRSAEENPIFVAQLEQLRHGNLEEKQRAAFMLRHFAAEHGENQIAIAKAGAIEPLVQLLEDSAEGLREEAVRALWNLARNNKEINVRNQVALRNAGAILPLVRLLEDEVPRVRVVTVAVLNDLALDNQVNQIAIAHAGAIAPLVRMLSDGREAPALVMAASLLQSLAKSGMDSQVAAALSGSVIPLVELLKADTNLAQEQAASSLGTLASYSQDIQVAIGRAGAIPPLVERLKGDMMQGTAALALSNLADNNVEHQMAIAQAGAIGPLVKLLEDGMPAVRSEAARALWLLARENLENQVAIVREGAAIPLVALLKGEAQEEATLTLLNLAAAA